MGKAGATVAVEIWSVACVSMCAAVPHTTKRSWIGRKKEEFPFSQAKKEFFIVSLRKKLNPASPSNQQLPSWQNGLHNQRDDQRELLSEGRQPELPDVS